MNDRKSETPRTDVFQYAYFGTTILDHAYKLERELTAAHETIAELTEKNKVAMAQKHDARRYKWAADNAILFIPTEATAPISKAGWDKYIDGRLTAQHYENSSAMEEDSRALQEKAK